MSIPIFWLGLLICAALLIAFGFAIYAVFFWKPKQNQADGS